MAKQQFDLIISGGGATGWSVVLALLAQVPVVPQGDKLKVALIDSFDSSKINPHPGFDARALALSQQSLRYFQQMNIADVIKQSGTAIHRIHVSDRGAVGQVVLDHQSYQEQELGIVMEAQQLGGILLNAADSQLAQSPNIDFLRLQPDRIIKADTHRNQVQIETEGGQSLETKLLVLAEGSASESKQWFNMDTHVNEYQQHAIIANVVTENSPDNTAFERFTTSGPLAFLPMTEQRSGVVWSIDSTDVERVMAMSDEDFLSALQTQFGFRLGKLVKTGKRQAYPLKLITTDDAVCHRVVCVGNASQTLHPIAGQGFNLALRDAWQLAAHVSCCKNNDEDAGSFRLLSVLKEARKKDQQQTIQLTDSLVHLFSNNNPLLTAGRNAGLLLMNNFSFLKDNFARVAMGQQSGTE